MNCPKCEIPIEDHPANACLDALFAELVMYITPDKLEDMCREDYRKSVKSQQGKGMLGTETWDNNCEEWRKKWWREYLIPEYSTNIAHAMEGVNNFVGYGFKFFFSKSGKGLWNVEISYNYSDGNYRAQNYAETLPLAITRALILWAMEKGK